MLLLTIFLVIIILIVVVYRGGSDTDLDEKSRFSKRVFRSKNRKKLANKSPETSSGQTSQKITDLSIKKETNHWAELTSEDLVDYELDSKNPEDDKPTGLKAIMYENNIIKVSWDKMKLVDYYVLQWQHIAKYPKDVKEEFWEKRVVKECSYTIENINKKDDYNLHLYAVDSDGNKSDLVTAPATAY